MLAYVANRLAIDSCALPAVILYHARAGVPVDVPTKNFSVFTRAVFHSDVTRHSVEQPQDESSFFALPSTRKNRQTGELAAKADSNAKEV